MTSLPLGVPLVSSSVMAIPLDAQVELAFRQLRELLALPG
jgi:hypothetical protein